MALHLGRLANSFPAALLRSPLHGVVSNRWTIIEFTGRKTGRRYRTPVAYVQEGDRVLVTTDSRWGQNLIGGAPVRLRLRGRWVEGQAAAVSDPDEAAGVLRRLVDAIPSYARPAGLQREGGRVSDAEIRRAVDAGRISIVVTLADRS